MIAPVRDLKMRYDVSFDALQSLDSRQFSGALIVAEIRNFLLPGSLLEHAAYHPRLEIYTQ